MSKEQFSEDYRRSFLKKYLKERERARTDLLFFCRDVLGYTDVTPGDVTGENHQPLLDGLHQFKGRHEEADINTGRITVSTPRVNLWDQEQADGKRNCLFLYPRDHLKTSVITIAHSLQWIINYEDIRILLSVSTGTQKTQLMSAFLGHFRSNNRFRFLFSEFCPPLHRASDWGSLEQVVVPNRTRQIKEPTIQAITIGQTIAGSHQDVHKHSDLVDKENVKTVEQIKAVNEHYGYTDPMLAVVNGKQGWRDVEGTRYDFSDVYGGILDAEEKLAPEEKTFRIVVRSAEVDAKKKTTLWPARYDWNALQAKKRNPHMSLAMYEAQYNQNVIPPSGGLATADEIDKMWIPRAKVRELMPYYSVHTTIDLAGMEEMSDGAFVAIVTCGFLPSGSFHVIDIRHGHLTPFEVIDAFFDVWKRYRPIDFKMEKNHHAQVLEPFLKQEMDKRGIYLNVLNIPRSNQVSKDNRIMGLQGFFKAKRVRIVDDLPCDGHLIMEMTRFPKFKYKDILDALSDQLQHANGDGIEPDLHPSAKPEDNRSIYEQMAHRKFEGFDPITHLPMFAGQDHQESSQWYHESTGL